ncbi:hypothetical protein [Microcoleus sp. CAWBG58]|nr:hypothetical protein [Microcoleus sp. CAWBG58]
MIYQNQAFKTAHFRRNVFSVGCQSHPKNPTVNCQLSTVNC